MAQNQKSSLARFLNVPGGISVKDAESRAELRLETMRDYISGQLAESVDCMGAYLGLLKGAPPGAVRGELRRLASDIASASGSVGQESLGVAARSTCALLDALDHRQGWDRTAVDVHFDALRVLLHHPGGEAAAQLADGLRRVTARAEQP